MYSIFSLHNRKIFFLILFCLIVQPRSIFPQNIPFNLMQRTSKRQITVGDIVEYSITIRTKSNVTVSFPEVKGKIGDFNVVDVKTKQKSFLGNQEISKIYYLNIFKTGTFEIPSLNVGYKIPGGKPKEAKTNAVEINVTSILSQYKDRKDIFDIKKPIALRSGRIFIYIIGLMFFTVIGFFIFRFVKNKCILSEKIEIKKPHELALEELECLKMQGYLSRGYISPKAINEFYSKVSFIIRFYIEGRFLLRAPEMTTDEFLVHAKNIPQLTEKQKLSLKEFLRHCDMVKFAKYGPSLEEMTSTFDSAINFVNETKEQDEKIAS